MDKLVSGGGSLQGGGGGGGGTKFFSSRKLMVCARNKMTQERGSSAPVRGQSS